MAVELGKCFGLSEEEHHAMGICKDRGSIVDMRLYPLGSDSPLAGFTTTSNCGIST